MASGQSPSSVGSSAAGAVGVGSKKRERMDGDNDVEVIQQQQSPSTRVDQQKRLKQSSLLDMFGQRSNQSPKAAAVVTAGDSSKATPQKAGAAGVVPVGTVQQLSPSSKSGMTTGNSSCSKSLFGTNRAAAAATNVAATVNRSSCLELLEMEEERGRSSEQQQQQESVVPVVSPGPRASGRTPTKSSSGAATAVGGSASCTVIEIDLRDDDAAAEDTAATVVQDVSVAALQRMESSNSNESNFSLHLEELEVSASLQRESRSSSQSQSQEMEDNGDSDSTEILDDSDDTDNAAAVPVFLGTAITDIPHLLPTVAEVPAPIPSASHSVLYRSRSPAMGNSSSSTVNGGASADIVAVLEPYPVNYQDVWDADHVRMPCSAQSLYPAAAVASDTGQSASAHEQVQQHSARPSLVARWGLVEKALLSEFSTCDDVIDALLSYNGRMTQRRDFNGLRYFCEEVIDEEELAHLLSSLVPAIARLAISLPQLVTQPPPLLKCGRNASVSLSQLQIGSLLANAFFCTYPRRNSAKADAEFANYPEINFFRLFGGCRPQRRNAMMEKIKCLLNYFRRITKPDHVNRAVTFSRWSLRADQLPVWRDSQCVLGTCRLHVTQHGVIEHEGRGLLQVDFANRRVGGGVLATGCVQEEIRFVLCPELIVSRLFTERLDDNECLIVKGCEQFSSYTGYADDFEWGGDVRDDVPFDRWHRRETVLVAIDATRYERPVLQYREDSMLRELNKAYCGFRNHNGEAAPLAGVATGNWGCGAFRGDPRLKFLLQLMAAAQAGRDMAYYTFGDVPLRDALHSMHQFLAENETTVGSLWKCLCQYSLLRGSESPKKFTDLYTYLYTSLL